MRRSRLLAIAAGILALTALGAAPARAQDQIDRYIGLKVTAVRFEVDGRPDASGTLNGLVDVKAGDPLRLIAVRNSVQRLTSVGSFDEDVSVVVSDAEGGVDVLFRLSARHPVDSLAFTGDPGLDPKELERRVKDQYGGMPTNVVPGRVAQAVRDILTDEGYLTAQVGVSVTKRNNPDRATLVFDVKAGQRAEISEAIINNRAQAVFSTEDLASRTGVIAGRPYRLASLNTALAAVRDDLQAKGYYAAVASFEPVVSADQRSVVVTLTVDAGPRVSLKWSGDPLPPGNVADFVPIARERAVDDDLLDDSVIRLEDALKADGYAKPNVTYTKDTSVAGLLGITFTIKRGPRYRVDHVVVPEGLHVTTPTFEALFGVKSGDILSTARVDAGMNQLRAKYRSLGFYDVQASIQEEETARPDAVGEVWIVLRPQIIEGPQGLVTSIRFTRETSHVPEADLRAHMRLKEHEPYVRTYIANDQDAISTLYVDRGFRTASVGIKPTFANDGRDVTLTVEITEGPQITVADIQVIGNQSVSDNAIIEVMTLRPGDPFGEAARFESQQKIAEMGLFRRVSIDEAPRLPGDTKAHVIVTVEEAPATTISWGGGVDAGRLKRTTADGTGQEDYVAISPRGFFAIQRRNLGGRNRSVDFFSRLALKPTSAPDDPTRDGHGYDFPEYRVQGSYRERRAFGTDADLLVGVAVEQGRRPSFNFAHRAASVELLKKVTPHLSMSGRYVLDVSRLFDSRIAPEDQLAIDRYFPQVRLSLISGSLLLDRRNDPVTPSRGSLSSADAEVAARKLGSQVGYYKMFLQSSVFHALSGNRRFVFAGRAQLGLTWGFAETVQALDENGNPILDSNGQPVLIQTEGNVPASSRFFAGGSTTVRGFQQDQLGVPEILDRNGLSNGGNGLVVLNAELRAAVMKLFGRGLTAVLFTDGGNVFARAADVDLSRLRGTAGFGVRYDSPLGPLRLDFGRKFTQTVFSGGSRERAWEFHFSIGEAF
ncbi:MAG TPA: POTRA domain-containing protein [Vicinamibacterales bacterium]|nr:POTRA domain-containing protein [Vicinamibacterales bacterium]